MHVDPLFGLSLLLAGCAAAAAVRTPADTLRRIRSEPGRTAARESAQAGSAARWYGHGMTILRPRPGAPPRHQRYLMAAVAGIVAALAWRLMIPNAGSTTWAAMPPVAIAVGLLLGRVESPAVRARRLRMTMDLPQVLELLAAAMQAGLPLRTAVRD